MNHNASRGQVVTSDLKMAKPVTLLTGNRTEN